MIEIFLIPPLRWSCCFGLEQSPRPEVSRSFKFFHVNKLKSGKKQNKNFQRDSNFLLSPKRYKRSVSALNIVVLVSRINSEYNTQCDVPLLLGPLRPKDGHRRFRRNSRNCEADRDACFGTSPIFRGSRTKRTPRT